MARKDFLETFLKLADGNAQNGEYRKALGIRAQKLPTHVALIPQYRRELAAIKVEEAAKAVPTPAPKTEEKVYEGVKYDSEALAKSRKERQELYDKKTIKRRTKGSTVEPVTEGDEEAMGSRGDSPSD